MKLSQLVEVVVNNEECVILKVKRDMENIEIHLMALGCFSGNETMMRITKGKDHTATLYTGSEHFSWYWGKSGYTLVSDQMRKCGFLIEACVQEDFGIYLGDNKQHIQKTLHIHTLADKVGKQHELKVLYWPKKEHERCNIHKDGEHFKWFENADEARNYVKERFDIKSTDTSKAPTGCIVERYVAIAK